MPAATASWGRPSSSADRRDAGDVGQVEAAAQPARDLDRPPRGGDGRRDARVQPAHRLGAGPRPRRRPRSRARRSRAPAARPNSSSRLAAPGGSAPSSAGPREQAPLGREVVLHVGVVVEVVAREVGEEGRREAGARHAPLHERVGGDLHRAGGVAGVAHPGEQRLEVDRVGGRVRDRQHLPADPRLDGPDQPACGGRPPRARHAAGTPRWSCRWSRSRRPRSEASEGSPASGGRGERHARRASAGPPSGGPARPQRPLHHRGGRAAGRRLGGVVVAVGAQRRAGRRTGRPDPLLPVGDRGGGRGGRGGDGARQDRSPISSSRVMRAGTLPQALGAAYGRILMFCRENSAIFSNAGAATSPP